MARTVSEALAALPYLTEEELVELAHAVSHYRGHLKHLKSVVGLAGSPEAVTETHRRMLVVQSLETAIAEARYSLGVPTRAQPDPVEIYHLPDLRADQPPPEGRPRAVLRRLSRVLGRPRPPRGGDVRPRAT